MTTTREPLHAQSIRDAIDRGGGQTCDVDGVLRELAAAGYEIRPAAAQGRGGEAVDLPRVVCDAIAERLGTIGGRPGALELNFPSKPVLVGLLTKAVVDRLAALAPQPTMGEAPAGWRDISTAPKDGTHILAIVQDALPPTTVHWFGPADLPGLRSGGWYLSVQQNEGPRVHPTKWQPLPSLSASPAAPAPLEVDEATVERVARAICSADGHVALESGKEQRWRTYERQARAAIRAG